MRFLFIQTSLIILAALSVVHAQEPQLISDTLLADIHASSKAYHEAIRNYDCQYTELRRTNKDDGQQKSTKRVVEDRLGQLRMESDIRRLDEAGNEIAQAKILHIYDLRKEIQCYQPDTGESDSVRAVTITAESNSRKMVQPRIFFTAEGRPFHDLIDELQARTIPIYGKVSESNNYPGTLVEFNYEEILPSGDRLQHEILLNMGEHFFPMRQVTFFNGKRFRVLQPSPQLVEPGILFPIEGTKISYNVSSEANELTSITNYAIERLEINTTIAPDTFRFESLPNDVVRDLRENMSTPDTSASTDDSPVG